jgi:hypothetical protein
MMVAAKIAVVVMAVMSGCWTANGQRVPAGWRDATF